MNLHKSQLRQQEQEQTATHQQAAQVQTAREFATPEELLRHDTEQNPVPSAVAERLNESVARENLQPPKSWWQKLLNR